MDENKSILIDKVVEKLKTVYDPEIPIDIYCLLYTSPSPRDTDLSRMPSSA